jgi:hypothetical protein
LAASPASSFRLPAFSAQASVSVADVEEAVPASSQPVEACAVAGARLEEAFAAEVQVGSVSAPDDLVRDGWLPDERVRDGYSAVPQAGGHCAAEAPPDDSLGDEPAQEA